MTKLYNVIIAALATIILSAILLNVVMYPEVYFTTWRYKLYNDLMAENTEAQKYYKSTYTDKGKYLFDEFKNVGSVKSVEKHNVNK